MFTEEEVNECFDLLVDRGPRLIPIESIEAMRSVLLDNCSCDSDEEE